MGPESGPLVVPRSARLAIWKKLLFACVPAVLLLLLGEGAARIAQPDGMIEVQREHEQLIEVLGLPALNETMQFDPVLFWRLKPELRSLRVAGKLRKSEFDFRVSTHEGLRSPPLGPEKRGLRILALGDSCTFGLGVDDDDTWPAQLERGVERAGVAVEVVNAGVPGYTAFQGARFFEQRGLALEPDWVVVSFGFNDRDLWSSRSDPETARDLAEQQIVSKLLRSQLYARLRGWLRPSTGSDLPGSEGRGSERASPDRKLEPRLSPWEFAAALSRIRELAEANQIQPLFVAWPYRSQVDQGIREVVHYQAILAEFARNAHIPFIHLAPRFIDERRSLFLDHVHANEEGNRVVAAAVGEVILSRLRTRTR